MVNINHCNSQIAAARLRYLEARYPDAKKAAIAFYRNSDNGKILGITRGDDVENVGFPGGKVEDGEDYKTACIRELKEETGCTGEVHGSRPLLYSRFEPGSEDGVCGTICNTYSVVLDAWPQTFEPRNEGTPGWFSPSDFLGVKCSFREYNDEVIRWKVDGEVIKHDHGLGGDYGWWLSVAKGLSVDAINYIEAGGEGPASVADSIMTVAPTGFSLVQTVAVLAAVYDLEVAAICSNNWLSSVAYSASS